MKIFITGASGFVGSHLALTLARDKNEVCVLLRDPSKAAAFTESGISVINGDLSDTEKLRTGMSWLRLGISSSSLYKTCIGRSRPALQDKCDRNFKCAWKPLRHDPSKKL